MVETTVMGLLLGVARPWGVCRSSTVSM